MTTATKITYTSASGDLDDFHRSFDEALARVRAAAGTSYPNIIGDQPVPGTGEPLDDTSPIDTSLLLGRFAAASAADVDLAVRSAKEAQRGWARRPWHDRVAVMRRAAELIRERKYDLAALMSLEVGKSRLEAMGDAEESADLIDYYCSQVEETDGFVRPMGQITPIERNTDVLRPYGVFVCIAPFNFPLALSTGMSSAALMAGNTVVYKPSEDTPWTGLRLAEIYRTPGLPAGAFNFLTGRREDIGDALWQHPGVDGVVFTGSKAVGLRIHAWHQQPLDQALPDGAGWQERRDRHRQRRPRCGGGRRDALRLQPPEPEVQRHLAGLRGSRRWPRPSSSGWWRRPAPSAWATRPSATSTSVRSSTSARSSGTSARSRRPAGRARSCWAASDSRGGVFDKGHFVAPDDRHDCPLTSSLYREELFVPFLAVGEVSGLDEAIAESNAAEYGLTAGIFSADQRRSRTILRRDRGGRLLRQQAERRHDRRLAGSAGVLRLEGLGLDGQGRVRAVLRRAVPARAEPDGDRSVASCHHQTGKDPACATTPRSWYPLPAPRPRPSSAGTRTGRPPATSRSIPLVVSHGRGPMVEDVDGNRYLDFMAGIAVCSTGYSHPKVVAAIKDAADRFLHICGSDFYYEGMAALCERLARIAPGPSRKRVFLTNSGTEATEGAIKLARYATRRTAIIAFRGAFHGRTTGAVTLTSSKARQHAGFGPLLPDVHHVPFAYRYRCQFCADQDGCNRGCLAAIEQELFTRQLDPGDVAAIFVEPIQGEGGYIVPPTGWLRDLRELCDRHGILLVADEVQCGVGRTGKMWACEHDGVEPDILLTAKGLGSGMPIGAIDRARVHQHLGERLARLDLRRQSGVLRRGARDARPGRGRADGERGHGWATGSWPASGSSRRSMPASATCAASA